MADRNAEPAPETRIEFRVGINLGDVIAEAEDIFGDGVNVAARLEGLAEPGAILISHTVHDHVRDRLPFGPIWPTTWNSGDRAFTSRNSAQTVHMPRAGARRADRHRDDPIGGSAYRPRSAIKVVSGTLGSLTTGRISVRVCRLA